MRRLLSRTSITIDEAVSILLGQSGGPVDYESSDGAENAEANRPIFCLQETLGDELDLLVDEHDVTNYEKDPTQVTPEKRAVLERHEAIVNQANVHRCAIDDELNKGERSVLKVDSALSNAVYRFITLHSFNEWRKQRAILDDSKLDRAELVGTDSEPVKVHEGNKKRKSGDKMRRQERAILDAIKKLGHYADALPPRQPGKAGIKAAVFEVVTNSGLFDNYDIFDSAWERLRKAKDIREVDPPPHKKS